MNIRKIIVYLIKKEVTLIYTYIYIYLKKIIKLNQTNENPG